MDKNILRNLDLSRKAVEIFLAALELGPSTIQKIAQKAGLPRSSCYLLVEELKNKGLMSQTKTGKKTILTPASPEHLLEQLKEKKQAAETSIKQAQVLLPQLLAIYNQQPQKPNVRFYEGLEGIKTILKESLKASEIFVLCTGCGRPIKKKLNLYLEKYFQQVVKNKIATYEIIGRGWQTREYQKKYSTPKNLIKIASFNKKLKHIDKLIFANQVAMISYENLNGVIIENQAIAEFEKELFWNLWNALKKTLG